MRREKKLSNLHTDDGGTGGLVRFVNLVLTVSMLTSLKHDPVGAEKKRLRHAVGGDSSSVVGLSRDEGAFPGLFRRVKQVAERERGSVSGICNAKGSLLETVHMRSSQFGTQVFFQPRAYVRGVFFLLSTMIASEMKM